MTDNFKNGFWVLVKANNEFFWCTLWHVVGESANTVNVGVNVEKSWTWTYESSKILPSLTINYFLIHICSSEFFTSFFFSDGVEHFFIELMANIISLPWAHFHYLLCLSFTSIETTVEAKNGVLVFHLHSCQYCCVMCYKMKEWWIPAVPHHKLHRNEIIWVESNITPACFYLRAILSPLNCILTLPICFPNCILRGNVIAVSIVFPGNFFFLV